MTDLTDVERDAVANLMPLGYRERPGDPADVFEAADRLAPAVGRIVAERTRAATERAEAAEAKVARVEALVAEWEELGRQADWYIDRAHHTEIREVMAEARWWFPERAADLRAALDGSPAGSGGEEAGTGSDSGRSVVPVTAAEGELVPEGHPDEKRPAE